MTLSDRRPYAAAVYPKVEIPAPLFVLGSNPGPAVVKMIGHLLNVNHSR